MSPKLLACAAALSVLTAAALRTDAPASGLRDGMKLIYGTNGQGGSTIDSVRNIGADAGAQCATVYLKGQATPAPPVRYCLRGDTLFTRDIKSGAWTVLRPVGARMTIDFVRASGNRVRYSTDSVSRWTLDGRSFTIVRTTVLTSDSTGKPLRRLVERYATALVTAVGGRFEAADSSVAGGWRETQLFELRAIKDAGKP